MDVKSAETVRRRGGMRRICTCLFAGRTVAQGVSVRARAAVKRRPYGPFLHYDLPGRLSRNLRLFVCF
jgi:hypothetical protein